MHEPVIDQQRFRDIALSGQRLHQRCVCGFAVWGALDQAPGDSLGARRVARRERCPRLELARVTAQLVEFGATLLDPGAGAARQELVLEKLARAARLLLRGRVPVLLERAVGELDVALGRFDVDPHVPRQREPQLAATLDAVAGRAGRLTPDSSERSPTSCEGGGSSPHRASARDLG